MAYLVAFHLQSRRGPLHRFDARLKLPLFILLVAAILDSGPLGTVFLSLVTVGCMLLSRLSLVRIAKELRLFALLLIVMFVARSLGATDGGAAPNARIFGILSATPASMAAAGMLVWRLVLLLLFGIVLAATTRLAHLQAAVAWYLRRLPFIPGGTIATMVGLTVSLIPLVFDTYREVADAQSARCIQGARRPVRRLRLLAAPLMLKTFSRADEIGAAMESRCYTEKRCFATLSSRPVDWMIALCGVLVAALAFTTDTIL